MPYEIAPTTSFTDEEHAQELLNELLEDGHDKDEMKGFIEIFGSKAFYENYEDYVKMVDQYDQETVDAFINADFDIDDISRLEDELKIGYDVEEDDLPDDLEDDSWIDGLLTSGFHPIEDDELFGEPISGFSLY